SSGPRTGACGATTYDFAAGKWVWRDGTAARRNALHCEVGLLGAVLVQLAVERLAVEPQQLGSTRLVAARLAQDLEDVLALEFAQREAAPGRVGGNRAQATGRADPFGQIRGADLFRFRERDRAF